MNWHTPKHLGLLLCTGPLLLLYTFSADACTTYTANNIWKLVLLALRLGLMLLKQLWFSASVVHQQPELCSSLSSVSLSFSLMFDQSVSFSDQSFNSRGESPPKDCLCLHSGLHSYLCAKLSKSVNYDINVHCSNQTPVALCVLFFLLVFWYDFR